METLLIVIILIEMTVNFVLVAMVIEELNK